MVRSSSSVLRRARRVLRANSLYCALCWTVAVLLSASALQGCKGRRKPSQLNAMVVDVSDVTVSRDPLVVAQGRKIFLQHCLQCHLPDGSGGVGANLTDDSWVLGGDLPTIIQVIAAGTTNGMPGWGGMLGSEDLGAVTSYIVSINPHLIID